MSVIKFRLHYVLLVLFFAGIWQGCNIINPPEKVPTYVHVDSFGFAFNPANPAPALSHQINSVWAYYNYNLIGVFDLPATFPVIMSDSGTLSLYPGVSVDGLNSFLSVYSFYQPVSTPLVAKPGSIVNVLPVSKYYSGFTCVSIFGTGWTQDTSSQVPLVFDSSVDAYKIMLTNPDDSSENYTTSEYTIPLNQDAFLELDYNSTNTFYIGIQANIAGTGIVAKMYLSGVNPSNGQWQKFYLSVKDFVAQYKATNYTFFIKASLDPGKSSSQVLLRNIQLLHY